MKKMKRFSFPIAYFFSLSPKRTIDFLFQTYVWIYFFGNRCLRRANIFLVDTQLKWINFRVYKISWIEDLKFSRGLNFVNQPVFHLMSFIFLGVLAKIAILKISRAWTKFREIGQNTRKSRKLIRAKFNPLKVYQNQNARPEGAFHMPWEWLRNKI